MIDNSTFLIKFLSLVNNIAIDSGSCSLWANILEATISGDVDESAQQIISLEPAFIDSIPHNPSRKTSFFANATQLDPGPTILFTDLTFGVPIAKAISGVIANRFSTVLFSNIEAA